MCIRDRGTDVRFDEHGAPILATAHMFNLSDKVLKDYLPTTIELGRSFVTLEYQSTRADSKGLFALDNLWDGLGALTVVMPNVKSVSYTHLDVYKRQECKRCAGCGWEECCSSGSSSPAPCADGF